nr:hypothetical protein [Brevibacillus laterosporus]
MVKTENGVKLYQPTGARRGVKTCQKELKQWKTSNSCMIERK